jgi:ketosteroid isomerase-like protein
MTLWELAAREEIRNTIASYAHLVDRGRMDEVAALFADDGTLEAGHLPPVRGRDAIRQYLIGTKSRLAATRRTLVRHHVTSVTVEMNGADAATASSYFLVLGERGIDHWGLYRDTFVRVSGQWLFLHRRVRTDGRSPDSWTKPGG